MKITTSAIFAAALLVSLPAKSELVSISDNGVYDTQSGITWATFPQTNLYSSSQLFSAMEEGGELYGWELADHNDIFQLWSNNVARYDENKHLPEFSITVEERAEWNSFFGITGEDNRSSSYYYNSDRGDWYAGGYYRDGYLSFFTENSNLPQGNYVVNGTYNDYYGYYLTLNDSFSLDTNGNLIAADVPLGAWFIALPFFAGLGLRKRRPQ